jgi:hypothetical protein
MSSAIEEASVPETYRRRAASGSAGGDASGWVSAMIRALTDLSSQTMPVGRSRIRLTVDAPAGSAGQPKRGCRRINWIARHRATRDNLDDSGFERLVSALAMVIG